MAELNSVISYSIPGAGYKSLSVFFVPILTDMACGLVRSILR